jgi:ubiquinone/menaquinone biosynthesis C-methylase UbiE
MVNNPRLAFFDDVAARWDGWEDLPELAKKLAAGLAEIGLDANETVLDVGCGTGNLTRALLARLSPAGRVVAVDLSPRMIAAARRKVDDPRVEWHTLDVRHLPFPNEFFHRAICYSVWPHFDNPAAIAGEFRRVLRPGGSLHIWHLSSRDRVNEIHAAAGEAVRHDLLPPAAELVDFLGDLGFTATRSVDDTQRYLVTAVKSGG